MPAKATKQPPIEQFSVVIVEWEDATASPSAQCSSALEALTMYQPCIRRTVAYFLYSDKYVTCLANDDDRKVMGPGAAGGLIYIPQGMVRSIEVVKKPSTYAKK